ncbi:MAG TPA: hypothetical protein VK279_05500, partial [Solirubrobacteraceae bacterium]|nr:hypothetical protein [Solirubrobacteraceae bacterium]
RRIDRVLAGGLPGRTTHVSPDAARRQLDAGEIVRRLRRAGGHGGRGPRLDFTFDAGPRVRVIVLDTTRRTSGSAGLVRPAQVAFVRSALRRAGDRLVILASHHRLDGVASAAPVLRLVDADPRVVALLHGDTHRNRIRPRAHAWSIGTSSLADWPQQARMLRVVGTAGGGVALETWMVDHAGGRATGIARELAYLDAQGGRPQGFAGRPGDRNARLFLPPPGR